MKHPNPLMLLYIAQGDALGFATEYIELPQNRTTKDEVLKFERYVKHPVWDIPAGHYTDDTQMSIANAEVLLEYNFKAPPTEEAVRAVPWRFADAYVRCFKRDPRPGYSQGLQTVLEKVDCGGDFLKTVDRGSDKNGAAMRSVPFGVLPSPDDVYYATIEQSKITHDTPGGRGSALFIGLMSHFAIHTDDPLTRIRERIRDYIGIPAGSRDLAPWPGGPVVGPHVGIKTACAVLTLLETETTMLGIARRAIEWGGDTDTVLAVAWGIASARMGAKIPGWAPRSGGDEGMRDQLPAFLDEDLENGVYGRDFLVTLGTRLMEKYACCCEKQQQAGPHGATRGATRV